MQRKGFPRPCQTSIWHRTRVMYRQPRGGVWVPHGVDALGGGEGDLARSVDRGGGLFPQESQGQLSLHIWF